MHLDTNPQRDITLYILKWLLLKKMITSVGEDVDKREQCMTIHCWWECNLADPLQNTVQFPQKYENRIIV